MAALAMVATSCSQEGPDVPAPDTSDIPAVTTGGTLKTVTFSGKLPEGIRSRANGDPSASFSDMMHFYCGIYDVSGNLILQKVMDNPGEIATAGGSQGEVNVSFKLADGTNYYAFFWTDNAPSTTTHVDLAAHTATIDLACHSWDFNAFCSELIPVNTSTATQYDVTLKRPYAEVVFVSNMTEDPVFLNRYPSGPFAVFGKRATDKTLATVKLPTGWDFFKDELTWEENFWYTDFKQTNSYMELVDGCKTKMVRNLLIGRTPQEIDAVFKFLDSPSSTSPYIVATVPARSYEANKRYIFVDKVDNSGSGGGVFFGSTTFNVVIDSDLDNSSQVTL